MTPFIKQIKLMRQLVLNSNAANTEYGIALVAEIDAHLEDYEIEKMLNENDIPTLDDLEEIA